MTELPMPVVIGLSMIIAGIGIGVWILITLLNASRRGKNLLD
ncbi:MAG: hypothetical protein RL174_491 [Actinomycetota bacterium]|jgi:hypothetical protein